MSEAATVPTPWNRLVKRVHSQLGNKFRGYRCTPQRVKAMLYRILPITNWLFHYNIKEHFIGDLVSGVTVGILNIPQGMAYGVLAGTGSVNGLYASFFPVLIYSLICTSHHASVGTFAVISLMTAGTVDTIGRLLLVSQSNSSVLQDMQNSSANDLIPIPMDIRVDVMTAVTLTAGIWEILFGIFRFGHLAVLLSDHLIKGFTCAAAFHVFTSQVKLVFGMPKLLERYGALKLVYFYYDFFAQITTVHIPTLTISIICVTILYFTRTFINQNPRVMKLIKIPVPAELLVMVFATLASTYLDLEGRWGVSTVHHIPTGLPAPRLPPYHIIPEVLLRSFSLAVVASAILISLARIFASKHHYKVDSNQELIALGAANIFGAFFQSIATSGGLARSTLQESVGGSTQMVSYVSAIVVLVVLLSLGKYLEPLPRAVLGSVIMVALINMLKQVLEVSRLWKISLIDASVFIVTFLSTLLLDVDLGLAVGVLYSLLTFAFRMQSGKIMWLGRVRGTQDDMRPLRKHPFLRYVDEVPGVKVVRLYGPLYSGNAERFIKKVRKEIDGDTVPRPGAAPELEEALQIGNGHIFHLDVSGHGPLEMQRLNESRNYSAIRFDLTLNTAHTSLLTEPLRAIIIDCSAISFVDVVGADHMKILASETSKKGLKLVFAACADNVRDVLILSGISTLDPASLFAHTVLEALQNVSVP